MTRTRPLLTLVLAGCSWAHLSLAQSGGEAAGGASGTAAPSGVSKAAASDDAAAADGTKPTDGTKPADGTTPTKPATGAGAAGATGTKPTGTGSDAPNTNPFGFGEGTDGTGGLPVQNSLLKPGNNGATTTFGLGQQKTGTTSIVPVKQEGAGGTGETVTKPVDNPTTFSAPGFFGAGQQQFTAGQGRFTRPRYRYTVSASMGFDDNALQTPDGGGAVPERTQRVVTALAVPEISETRNVQVPTDQFTYYGGAFHPVFRTERRTIILRRGVPEQTVLVTIPGIPGQPRSASVVTGLNGSWDVQWVKARSALTFDLNAGVEYYWNRPGTAADYTGGLSFAYVRRVSSRMQFSANTSLGYQSQPDYSRVNLQQQGRVSGQGSGQGSGAYLSVNTKYDLTYRWGHRFHTDTSFSLDAVLYADSQRKSSNFWQAVLGNEFQYLYSSRVSLIGELRYGVTRYLDAGVGTASRDSNTVYLLVGSDYQFSRRTSLTFRLGESARSYTQSTAGNSLTPYGEGSLRYQYNARSTFGLSGRYGFEEAANPGDQNTVARVGISASRAFTPRLSSSLGINLIQNNEQSAAAHTTTARKVTDINLSLAYRFDRHFTMSTRLNYTLNSTSLGTNDYDHTRFFVTGQYEF